MLLFIVLALACVERAEMQWMQDGTTTGYPRAGKTATTTWTTTQTTTFTTTTQTTTTKTTTTMTTTTVTTSTTSSTLTTTSRTTSSTTSTRTTTSTTSTMFTDRLRAMTPPWQWGGCLPVTTVQNIIVQVVLQPTQTAQTALKCLMDSWSKATSNNYKFVSGGEATIALTQVAELLSPSPLAVAQLAAYVWGESLSWDAVLTQAGDFTSAPVNCYNVDLKPDSSSDPSKKTSVETLCPGHAFEGMDALPSGAKGDLSGAGYATYYMRVWSPSAFQTSFAEGYSAANPGATGKLPKSMWACRDQFLQPDLQAVAVLVKGDNTTEQLALVEVPWEKLTIGRNRILIYCAGMVRNRTIEIVASPVGYYGAGQVVLPDGEVHAMTTVVPNSYDKFIDPGWRCKLRDSEGWFDGPPAREALPLNTTGCKLIVYNGGTQYNQNMCLPLLRSLPNRRLEVTSAFQVNGPSTLMLSAYDTQNDASPMIDDLGVICNGKFNSTPVSLNALGIVSVVYACNKESFERQVYIRQPLVIKGVDAVTANHSVPAVSSWTDTFAVLDPVNWVAPSSALIVCGGVQLIDSINDALSLKARGHRALYYGTSQTVTVKMTVDHREPASFSLSVLLEKALDGALVLNATFQRTMISTYNSICRMTVLGTSFNDTGCSTPPYNIELSMGSQLLNIRFAGSGRTSLTYPALSFPIQGELLLPSLAPADTKSIIKDFQVQTAQKQIALSTDKSIKTIRMLMFGQDNKVPEYYTPPTAECVYVDTRDPRLPVKAMDVQGRPAQISTTKARGFSVVYNCSVRANPSTKLLRVEVVDALKLRGSAVMPKIRVGNTQWQDAGATCVDVNMNTVTSPSRLYSDQATALNLATPGFYNITWTCCPTADCNPKVTKSRRVEVIEALLIYGADPYQDNTLQLNSKTPFVDPGARCATNDGTTTPATFSAKWFNGTAWVAAQQGISQSSVVGAPQGLFYRFLMNYTCPQNPLAYKTREVWWLPNTKTIACHLNGVGQDAPRYLEAGEVYTDPGACCHNEYRTLYDVQADSLAVSTPGAHAVNYRCRAFTLKKDAVRTVITNMAPTIYLVGPPTTRAVLGQPFAPGGVTCVDSDDGVVQYKVLDRIARRLPVIRGALLGADPAVAIPDLPRGHVENVFDNRTGSCGATEPNAYDERFRRCFRDLQVGNTTARVLLDLGNLRIVHMVAVDGYYFTGSGLTRSRSSNGKVRVELINGDRRTVCAEELALGASLACAQRVPARYIEVRALQPQTIICEVRPYGEVSPDAAAKLRLVIAPSGAQACSVVGTYNCSLWVDYGKMWTRYRCLVKTLQTSPLELHRQALAEQDTFSGSWSELRPFDKWVLRRGPANTDIIAEAVGGSNMPAPQGWLTKGALAACKVNLVAQDCTTCPGWPETSCKDAARVCAQAVPVREEPVPSAYIQIASNVDVMTVGTYYVSHTCVDNLGASATVTRTVFMSCEAPNTHLIFGGNALACRGFGGLSPVSHADWSSCAEACATAGIEVCEAYQFWNATWAAVGRKQGDCIFHNTCTGRLMRNETIENVTKGGVFVGYCRRKNSPPEFVLEGDGAERFTPWRDRASALPTGCLCQDFEDAVPFTCGSNWADVVVASPGPGRYNVTWVCTDSAGETSKKNQSIAMTGSCMLPNVTHNGGCLEDAGTPSSELVAGAICDIQCDSAVFSPNFAGLSCQLPGGKGLLPRWELTTAFGRTLLNDSFTICSASPCNEPKGIENVSVVIVQNGTRLVEAPCKNSMGTGMIPHGGSCFTACAPGYATLTPELKCDLGTFQPQTFQCQEQSLGMAGIDGVPTWANVTLSWSPARRVQACRSTGISLQVRFVEHGEDLVAAKARPWLQVYGEFCNPENLTVTENRTFEQLMRMRCVVTHVVNETGALVPMAEGQGYVFRIMERCEENVFNSKWQESLLITVLVIPVPTISFRIPASGDKVYSSPELVVALISAPVITNWGSGAFMRITRWETPGCTQTTYALRSSAIKNQSTTDYGTAGLTGNAIVTFTPVEGMWASSCSYTVTFQEGLLITPTYPSRVNPNITWDFKWEEYGPALQYINWQPQGMKVLADGVEAVVDVRYDMRANFTCWATAVDLTSPLSAAAWEEEDWLTVGLSMTAESQVGGATLRPTYSPARVLVSERVFTDSPNVLMSMKIGGMVPNTQYRVTCGGSKYERYWVSTSCEGKCVIQAQTSVDALKDLAYVNVTRLWLCPKDDTKLEEGAFPEYTSDIQNVWVPSQVTQIFIATTRLIGQLLQVEDWEAACNRTLDPTSAKEKYAYMRLHIAPVPAHRYSSVHWIHGPFVDIKYEKQGDTSVPLVITRFIDFRVCPHSSAKELEMLPNASCQVYTSSVAAVYGTIGIERLNYLAAGVDGTNMQIQGTPVKPGTVVDLVVGQWVRVHVHNEDGTLNVTDMGITLGRTGDGFKQDCILDYDDAMVSFRVVGQGLRLPMFVIWRGTDFPTSYMFNVIAPSVKQDGVRMISLVSPTPQRVSFELLHYKNEETISLLSSSTLAPASIYRLSLRNVAQTGTGVELCEDPLTESWGKISCTVVRSPLRNVRLFLMVRDFSSTAADPYVPVDAEGLPNLVQFETPGVKCLGYGAEDCKATDTLQLGAYDQQSIQAGIVTEYMYIRSTSSVFPNLDELVMTGTPLKEYRVNLAGKDDDDPEIPLCKTVTRESPEMLKCTLARCLDVRRLTTYPKLVLRFGDLSKEISDKLALPAPKVDTVDPKQLNDTGTETITLKGVDLGRPLGPKDSFTKACVEMQYSIKNYSFIQKFGSLSVRIGDADCKIVYHTEELVKCVISTPVREARSPPKRGQARGALLPMKQVVVSIGIGLVTSDSGRKQVPTVLSLCPNGQRRIRQESIECELCPPGMFARTGLDDSPLQCSRCPPHTYQDKPGSVDCQACPENTQAGALFATSREECVCLPGFYSPVWNENRSMGVPGYRCQPCQSTELITTAPRGMLCGRDIAIRPLCDEDRAQTCVSSPNGRYEYRVCKAYCPGGTHLPMAKPQYYFTGAAAVTGTTGSGIQEYRPELVRCEPPQACDSRNRCAVGYSGEACQECVFGYFRDRLKGNVCTQCDESTATGTVIMTGAAMMFTLGAFMGSLLYLKLLADPIFKSQFDGLIIRTLRNIKAAFQGQSTGLKRPTASGPYNSFLGWVGLGPKRQTIRLTKQDLSAYLQYFRTGDLGMIIRVDDNSVCHVAAVIRGSPASIKGIEKNWELRLVNGRRIKAHTEFEVRLHLARAEVPVTLTFRGVRSGHSLEEDEGNEMDAFDPQQTMELGSKAFDTLRMATMTLSILQSFTFVARLDLDWPPIFRLIAKFFANITLDFSFFHPECSVEAPFEQAWLGFLLVPYGIIFSIGFAYVVMRFRLCFVIGWDQELRRMNEALLRSAFFKATLSVLLVFLSNHMELLWAPFTCNRRDDGKSVMLGAQDIECSFHDKRYRFIFSVGIAGWSILSIVYAALLWCMHKAYHWQVGARMRHRVPDYVAAVENAASGMKGYNPNLSLRVSFNIVAPRVFPADESNTRYFQHTTLSVSERNMDFREMGDDEDEFGNPKDNPKDNPKENQPASSGDPRTNKGRRTYREVVALPEELPAAEDSSSGQDTNEFSSSSSDIDLDDYFYDKNWGWDLEAWEREGDFDDYFDEDIMATKDLREGGRLDDFFESDEEDPSHRSAAGKHRAIDKDGAKHAPPLKGKPALKKKPVGYEDADTRTAATTEGRLAAMKRVQNKGRAMNIVAREGQAMSIVAHKSTGKAPMRAPDVDPAKMTRDEWGAMFDRICKEVPGKITKAEFGRQHIFKAGLYANLDTDGIGHFSRKQWLKVYDDFVKNNQLSSLAHLFAIQKAAPKAATKGAAAGTGTMRKSVSWAKEQDDGSPARHGKTRSEAAAVKAKAGKATSKAFPDMAKSKTDPLPQAKVKAKHATHNSWAELLSMFCIDDPNHHGRLNRKEWSIGFSAFDVDASRKITEKEWNQQTCFRKELFKAIDSSGNGSIDLAEWDEAFQDLCDEETGLLTLEQWVTVDCAAGKKAKVKAKHATQNSWAELLSMFCIDDPTHHGRLNRKEWIIGFSAFDVDASKKITEKEWGLQSYFRKELFKAIDSSGNGSIDLAEWDEAFQDLCDDDTGLLTLEQWVTVACGRGKQDKRAAEQKRTNEQQAERRRQEEERRQAELQREAELEREAELKREKKEAKRLKKEREAEQQREAERVAQEQQKREAERAKEAERARQAERQAASPSARPQKAVSSTKARSDGVQSGTSSTRVKAKVKAKHATKTSWSGLLAMFSIDDPSHDGRLKRSEWMNGYTAFDTDASDDLTLAEFSLQKFLLPELFAYIDTSGEGLITADEWDQAFDDLCEDDGRLPLARYSPITPSTDAKKESRARETPSSSPTSKTRSAEPSSLSMKKTASVVKATAVVSKTRKQANNVASWAEVLSMFGIVDARHDGRVTREQWMTGHAAFDVDASGNITEVEWDKQRCFRRELFQAIDADESGKVDLRAWEEAFDFLCDDNGRLRLDEWVQVAKKEKPEVSSMKNSRSEPVKRSAGARDKEVRQVSSAAVSGRSQKKVRAEAPHMAAPPGAPGPSSTSRHGAAKRAASEPEPGRQPPSATRAVKATKSAAAATGGEPKDMTASGTIRSGHPQQPTSSLEHGGRQFPNPVPARKLTQIGTRRADALKREGRLGRKARMRKKRREQILRIVGIREPHLRLRYKPGALLVTTTETAKDTILAGDSFRRYGRISWTDTLSGSFLSYGWVLLVNNFGRAFCLMATICMTASIPPIAASGQASVFFFNFGLILKVMPYSNYLLSLQEALLVGCLALLVWGASFRDLLQNHERAQDFPATVQFTGQLIDVIVLILCCVIAVGIASVGVSLVRSLMKVESEDQALNRAYAYRVRSMQRSRAFEQRGRDPVRAAREGALREQDLQASINTHLTQVALEMSCFERSEYVPPDDMKTMRKIFRWMLKGCANVPRQADAAPRPVEVA